MSARNGRTKTKSAGPLPQETFGLLLLSIRLGLIRRGERILSRYGFDINFTQFRVMRALNMVESISATELARNVEHDGGALTRLLDRLQEKGYVARRPNPNDRRSVDVFLTPQGRAAWSSMQKCVMEINEEALAVLTEKEQRQLFDLMHRIRDHFDRATEEA